MSFDDTDDGVSEAQQEAHERRITRCSCCRARIVFLRTASGKSMPVEADCVDPLDESYDATRHESHFARCPGANKHRKSR